MAFLIPIVTFLSPIAAFSCKFFYKCNWPTFTVPYSGVLKPYSDVLKPYSGVLKLDFPNFEFHVFFYFFLFFVLVLFGITRFSTNRVFH